MKHKSFIFGALTTSITWIVVLYLYSKLSADKSHQVSQHLYTHSIEPWRQPQSNKLEIGQIQSMEEKLRRDAGYDQHSYNVIVSERYGIRRAIPDTRDPKCGSLNYDIPSSTTISVIICFYNEHPTTLLRSVASIVERTPAPLLKEVVMIDDFSGLPNDSLLSDLEAISNKVQVVRNSQRQGLIRSRVFGARLAQGDILVFLDSHIEVNLNWIEPLIHPIVLNRTVATVPVVDIINPDTFEYSSSPIVKGGFNWGLHFKWDPLVKIRVDPTANIPTPTMPGGLFAIERKYFKEIGEFDMGMDIWGGENLEISFRLWTCGGSIYIIPCSRVGHVFRKRRPYGAPTHENTILKNNLRLANVWLDEYKEYFLKTFKSPPKVRYGDIESRIELRKSLKCKPFSWYHTHVYPEMQIPGNKTSNGVEPIVQPWYMRKRNYVKHFGIQYKDTNFCIQNLNKKGKETIKKGDLLLLKKCSDKSNQKWYTTDKHEVILNRLLCLEAQLVKGGPSIFLSKCHESGADQEWNFIEGSSKLFKIYNKATGMCLMANSGKSGSMIDMKICGDSAVWKLV